MQRCGPLSIACPPPNAVQPWASSARQIPSPSPYFNILSRAQARSLHVLFSYKLICSAQRESSNSLNPKWHQCLQNCLRRRLPVPPEQFPQRRYRSDKPVRDRSPPSWPPPPSPSPSCPSLSNNSSCLYRQTAFLPRRNKSLNRGRKSGRAPKSQRMTESYLLLAPRYVHMEVITLVDCDPADLFESLM